MRGQMELTVMDLLKIINGYANQGGDAARLAGVFETLKPYVVTNALYKEEDIYKKIYNIISKEKDTNKNITHLLKEYITSTDGIFNISDCYTAVGASDTKSKGLVRKVLSTLCDNGDIEHVGTKTGNYMTIDKSITYTDFKNAKPKPSLPLTLPLNIHKRTLFFPSCIVGIAGCTGHGKSTWALNIIRENQDKMKIKYFYMPELGVEGLRRKLEYFDMPIQAWGFDAICGSNGNGKTQWDANNIHQKIFPGCLNIIDYLEPPEDAPWKIFHVTNKIAGRLGDGMAIILIQKKEGAKYGIGGDWSAKATSLYVSLEWGSATIQKNTYSEEDKIGRGFNTMDFDIKHGWCIKGVSGWYGEDKKRDKEKNKVYADRGIIIDTPDPDFPHEEE